ncbi:HAD-IA family hydrolase [Actinosynnema sp. NPDC020468]|uniref:HAD family hydrolase n=1 Tax=Actinosynnema sp. NPDC020468 TaxID=3154488 RepID=UPI0033ED81C3
MLRYAATLGDTEAREVEAVLSAYEIKAVHSAEPTAGAHDLMRAWHDRGRPLAIVSNNSTAAVTAYLRRHDLHSITDYVSARNGPQIDQLKPSPQFINQALDHLSTSASRALLVGDSGTDIRASRAAKVIAIGYANKVAKLTSLKDGAACLVTSMRLQAWLPI